jgi:iron complex transport system substrate-binding protein
LLRDPVLANLPSVAAGQVYGLGRDAFRIDAYSAGQIIDTLLERFGT